MNANSDYNKQTDAEDIQRRLKNKPFSHLLNFWKGRGRGLEVTQGPPKHRSSSFTRRMTKLVKVTPSLCWLQELVHFSDITQRSNLPLLFRMKRRATAWSSSRTHLFGRDGVQALCVARLTAIFYIAVWEMIQKFVNACINIAWSGGTCVRSVRA